jgi:N-methylhydantoinase A
MGIQNLRLGIDIGGTFTDLTLADSERGVLRHSKVPSTPQSPADALINGLVEILAVVGAGPAELEYLVHGTTLALNTLLQRQGARVALIVCNTNRNVLDLGRLRVSEQFSFSPSIPKPIVAPEFVRGIAGRILADGQEYEPLDADEIALIPAWLKSIGAESCAIALLNSYKNPEHERRLAFAIQSSLPSLPLSVSSDIWPEIREYERTMVTVMNAYVAPQMNQYFSRLTAQLRQLTVRAVPLITRSNGGLMTVDEAAERPIETLLSGPASGVVGARYAALSADLENCITFDMGGTSADMSVIMGREPLTSSGAHVGDFPVVIPAVDVAAIGAGGGSVAWLDSSGVLKVGPRSAGAEPGPACYGRGGEEATVTDAYLLCGFLDPAKFAGGKLKLYPNLAEKAIGRLGKKIGFDPYETAVAILRIATATMAARVGPLMASLGIDARTFTLLPYGGAGPVHACLLAQEIGIEQILVPSSPGTLCATGALINDMSRDWVRTHRCLVDQQTVDDAARVFTDLDRIARSWLREQPVEVESSDISMSIDMRYVGQAYEIEVPLGVDGLKDASALTNAFHVRHESIHRHSDIEAPVEIVNLRVHAVGRTKKFQTLHVEEDGRVRPELYKIRPLRFGQGSVDGRVYQRQDLKNGFSFRGPAIIEQEDTTVVVPPSFCGRVDESGNLLIQSGSMEMVDV